MTFKEAKEAMKTHRVKHRYFSEGEWVTRCGNSYHFEDGVSVNEEEFNTIWGKDGFAEGWDIIKEEE